MFRGYAAGGVPPEIVGTGPMVAIPKVLRHTGIRLRQVDLIELNEASASQTVYVIDRMRVGGGVGAAEIFQRKN
ncbi:MAG: hypothetical protein HYY45_15835 [Deltaproteobacteria bacterium]|nr:hypothetical protein [Deltaproteobacteria bacterium]